MGTRDSFGYMSGCHGNLNSGNKRHHSRSSHRHPWTKLLFHNSLEPDLVNCNCLSTRAMYCIVPLLPTGSVCPYPHWHRVWQATIRGKTHRPWPTTTGTVATHRRRVAVATGGIRYHTPRWRGTASACHKCALTLRPALLSGTSTGATNLVEFCAKDVRIRGKLGLTVVFLYNWLFFH